MPTVAFHTLGCKVNHYETEAIWQWFKQERQPINGVHNIMKNRVYEELDVPTFTDRTRASLKIQEGCNNFCTFCIIPWARGLMRSRDPKEVIHQAQQLVDAGYKEIV